MTKFRAGDHVRIIHTPCRYFDRVVTIREVTEGQAHPYRVDELEPWPLWFGPHELILAEHQPTDPNKEK